MQVSNFTMQPQIPLLWRKVESISEIGWKKIKICKRYCTGHDWLIYFLCDCCRSEAKLIKSTQFPVGTLQVHSLWEAWVILLRAASPHQQFYHNCNKSVHRSSPFWYVECVEYQIVFFKREHLNIISFNNVLNILLFFYLSYFQEISDEV